MNKKSYAVLILMVSSFLCFSALAPAGSLAAGASVSLAPGVSGVPAEVITDLENSYGPGDAVTILSLQGRPVMTETENIPVNEVEGASRQAAASEIADQASAIFEMPIFAFPYFYTDVSLAAKQRNIAVKSDFVTSVAKGQTGPVGTAYKGSIACMIAGNLPADMFGMASSLKVTIPAEEILVGPAEESSANSREYRVKYYCDKGSYHVRRENIFFPLIYENITGNWTAPAFSIIYCIDRYIE